MKAILLAAGEGTRLQPVTNHIPKCLVPIHGKPLLEFWLENLSNAGVSRFLINTHYLSDQVEEYVANSQFINQIDLVHEEDLLNTGGTIIANKTFIDNEPFMAVHADNLSFCDFRKFICSHKNRVDGTEITMMTFESDTPENCGILELDELGVVQGFHEKTHSPPSNIANAAVYIMEYSVISEMEKFGKQKIDISLDIIPKFLGRIGTFKNDIYHRDIGSLESFSLAQIEYSAIKVIK